MLGDWTDPIERPADAAWWAMSHHDRWQVHQDRRRAAARERSPEAEREHERWLESMMKMAM